MGLRILAAALALAPAALAASGPAPGRDLKAFYRQRCAMCHGLDGSGRGAGGQRLGGRALADPKWQARVTDEAMAAAILRGKGAMPGFRTLLSEADARTLAAEVLRPMAARRK